MKGQLANIGSIGDVLKGKVPYKNIMVNYAKALNESSKMITTVFKLDTRGTDKKTKAKDDIWEKWGDFEQKAQKLVETSGAMVVAAQSGDMGKIGPAMKAMGGACAGCHKAFRKKKK